jgi:hypothetical protein
MRYEPIQVDGITQGLGICLIGLFDDRNNVWAAEEHARVDEDDMIKHLLSF